MYGLLVSLVVLPVIQVASEGHSWAYTGIACHSEPSLSVKEIVASCAIMKLTLTIGNKASTMLSNILQTGSEKLNCYVVNETADMNKHKELPFVWHNVLLLVAALPGIGGLVQLHHIQMGLGSNTRYESMKLCLVNIEGNEGENNWPTKYSFCGGVYQSPLDFHGSFLQYDSTLKPIQLYGYNASSTNHFTMSNNGHTVSVSLPPSMYIEIPPFRYIASQLHFHWGSLSGHKGSEHCISGKRFPAEMHIVHYNAKYADVGTALEVADGLAVLGILIETGSFNPAYNNILSQLAHIKYKGQNFQISGFNVRHLIPESLDEYYRYEGSLTTPPCNPSVLWSVFRNPVLISEEQLLLLETTLYRTDRNSSVPVEMIDNYRRPQQEGDRLVSMSFREGIVLAVTLACILGTLVIIAVTCWLFRRKKWGKDTKNVVYTPAVPMEESNTSKV